MTLPTGPWAVDITDFKFQAHGETWCLSIEFESADDGYTPQLWILTGTSWQTVAMWMGGHVRSSEELKKKFGDPSAYLRAICAWATERIRTASDVPLPTPGDALSRSLYHMKKSLSWDGEKLVSPGDLQP